MKSIQWIIIPIAMLFAMAMTLPVLAQTIKDADDGTTLEQVIIFGRHSIRSTTVKPTVLAQFSSNRYPLFEGVQTGYLTPNGREAARLFGAYFRDYLLHEGLLTGSAPTDLSHSYFRANSIQRSNMTAAKFGEGLIPDSTVPVHSFSIGDPPGTPAVPDPVFDPVLCGVATVVSDRALLEVQGMYGSGGALASAYSGELSLIRDVLSPPGTVDPTSQTSHPFTLTAITNCHQAGSGNRGLHQSRRTHDGE